MRYLFSVLGFVLFLLFVSFVVKNSGAVVVRYFLGYEWRAPLAVVLLLFFVLGAVAGVLATLVTIVRQRRQIAALKSDLATRGRPLPPTRIDPVGI